METHCEKNMLRASAAQATEAAPDFAEVAVMVFDEVVGQTGKFHFELWPNPTPKRLRYLLR